MTNSNNNEKNSSGEEVLARFQGEEARKIIAVIKAGDSLLRFNIIRDEDKDGNNPPVVELIKEKR